MEFHCSKPDAQPLVAGNRAGRSFALPFSTFKVEANSAPTFVEQVTTFLERYRAPVQRIPPARA
jgi:hypothetical protein